MGEKEFDLMVIGSGPGGYVAGIRAGQLGMKVAVVEKDPKFGGTCLHRGCIPTKALLHTAEVYDEIREADDLGIQVAAPSLDIAKVHARKRKVVDKNARGIEGLFKKYKTIGLHGRGRLVGAHEVEVDGPEGKTLYQAKNILIATGSVPARHSHRPGGRRADPELRPHPGARTGAGDPSRSSERAPWAPSSPRSSPPSAPR